MMDEKLFNRVPQIRSYRPIIYPDYIVVGRSALSLILAYNGPFDINSDMIIMMPRLQGRGLLRIKKLNTDKHGWDGYYG
jgi:hypothetical protein